MEDARVVMMEYGHRPGLIASHVAKTLQSFRNFEGALSKVAESSDVLEGASRTNFLVQIENDFNRFKMWVSNQAAHQSGSASLDYRLREASHLQQQVIYLLNDTCKSLQAATSLFHDSSTWLKQDREDGKDEIFQDDDSQFSPPDSGEGYESDFSDPDSDKHPSSGLPTLLTDIGEGIDCLLRLSVAIANPTPHERFRKLGTAPSQDLPFCQPRDGAYVRGKFPGITDEMVDALGMFITRRRHFFKYRLAHHENLASDKETDSCSTEPICEEPLPDAGMLQNSNSTPAIHTFTGTDQSISTLTMPPRPSAKQDGIFECPYCYRLISAKTKTAWEQHVFGDLRPYTCVFRDCIESNSDFDRRCDWKSHVSKYHWRSWLCPFKCQQPFSASAELSLHIRENHFPTGTEEELKSIAALGERPAPDDTSSLCPLCKYSMKGLEGYIDHVGCHLEELALLALRSVEEGDLEDEAEINVQSWSRLRADADSPQVFSAKPSPVLETHPRPSFESPCKGKEAVLLDDAISDTGSLDLLRSNLKKKAVRLDSWSKGIKVETPVSTTPDTLAAEEEMKYAVEMWNAAQLSREDNIQILNQSQKRMVIGTNKEPNKESPTDYPGNAMPAHSQPAWYDRPGCSEPATLQPPTAYSGYYMPQQHNPVVQAAAIGSVSEVPVSCVYPGCTARPFRRKADLERHIEYTHSTGSNKDTYLCDYSGCHRDGEPFYRKDIFRRHLEQFHREEISERGASSDMGSHKTTWWRCPRCLARVYISEHGFECPSCKTESKSEGKRRSWFGSYKIGS